ncbi:atp-dependent 6-phosphofructokinase [Lucifera butyrica]|uniref:Pyrophosphate--fructose 6-phosphate 1-phosphotransferase n=1 Tax=Lucifera butyrica TaxID=1351585 RepID=A0A498R394_9FIRM|nr:6-phosphofructokinase [Lucifera butyrica]VBB05260.1 atp-dependent 6-phosphofructokinase [Lucifera butyrica]
MAKLRGNAVVAQSGGPTAVINASACGVIQEALKHEEIENVYGAQNGIVGILNGDLFDVRKENPAVVEGLKYTPGAALGSVRYKVKTREDYERIFEALKKHNIRYFFYNGGNDSMDTADKVNKLAVEKGYEMRCIGVPKTVDNDLPFTDHCPGYASAAKYLATTVAESWIDQRDLPSTKILIVEAMGRHAGWLAAAGALAKRADDDGPHLVYLPEVVFDTNQFVKDVQNIYKAVDRVLIVVSEGIHTADGTLLGESGARDAFGHAQLGGCAQVLKDILDKEVGAKSRYIIPASAQRAAAHVASLTDINEAWLVGKKAVEYAVEGISGVMVTLEREPGNGYRITTGKANLSEVANVEKKVPLEWINAEGNNVTADFINYARPLLEGEPPLRYEGGIPVFSRLAKHFIVK